MNNKKAIERILSDYKHLKKSDINYSIEPLNDNMMVWHGNLVPYKGRYQGFIIHYEMNFTNEYPSVPPKIFLKNKLPHTNIFSNWDPNPDNYSICLDLITVFTNNTRKKSDLYLGGWSSSYTMETILLQLETFLFEDYAEQENGNIIKTYIKSDNNDINICYEKCVNYVCNDCGHTFNNPKPVLKNKVPYFRLAKENLIKIHDCYDKSEINQEFLNILNKNIDNKNLFKKMHYNNNIDIVLSNNLDHIIKYFNDFFIKNNFLYLRIKKNQNDIKDFIKINNIELIDCYCDKIVKWDECVCIHSCDGCIKNIETNFNILKTNNYFNDDNINEKNIMTYANEFLEINNISDRLNYLSKNNLIKCDNNNYCVLEELLENIDYYPDLKPSNDNNIIMENNYNNDNNIIIIENNDIKKENIDYLSNLPDELLFMIGYYLDFNSRNILRNFNDKLKKHFMHPYYIEREQLICYYSKKNINDDIILGYPIKINYYQNSSIIQNIESGFDLLSNYAYNNGCRKTALNTIFQFWLPVINFNTNNNNSKIFKTLIKEKIIEIATSNKSIRLKCQLGNTKYNNLDEIWNNIIVYDSDSNVKTYSFEDRLMYLKSKMENPELYFEEFVIDILSNLMSSAVVEIMNNDVIISEKALECYCRWHHLFYYLSEEYPEIQNIINNKISDFIKNVRSRHKDKIPNMGKFLSYLSISKKYSWYDIQEEYMDESNKRNIYWILKDYPNMIPDNIFYYTNDNRLKKIWDVVKVGKKLNVFYYYFLNNIAKSKSLMLSDVINNYNYYYGLPSREIRDTFKDKVKEIMNIDSWKDYYNALGLHYHGDNYLSKQFYRTYIISNKIGYNQYQQQEQHQQ